MNEIEEKFYKTFGIGKKCCFVEEQGYECGHDCSICDNPKYPPITDRILLELICIYIGYERIYMGTFELGHFRRFMLAMLIDLYKEMRDVNKKERLKHQVQSLFTEGNDAD